MKTSQCRWTREQGWDVPPSAHASADSQIVLVFGETDLIARKTGFEEIAQAFPAARIVGCSTAGEICGSEVSDHSIVATAVTLERSEIRCESVEIESSGESYGAGESLGRSLAGAGLQHVFVLSDGLKVNGSDLARGFGDALSGSVAITGGLSGDGDRFSETMVIVDGEPSSGAVVALGFYGDDLRIGYGSFGGWDPFGPQRLITRSEANVLYELDGNSALSLYKDYLGEYAKGLPASGLLFPLTIWKEGHEHALVRTILSVDEEKQSLTFAGDIPQGWHARLMKANFERLIDGSTEAARASCQGLDEQGQDLAILISCVGRKMILEQRTEEELEAVQEILGTTPAFTGFYSYGEIAPFVRNGSCELHNQTMTVTTFGER